MTQKLSPNEKMYIAEMYHKGLYSQRELADLYEVSRATVRRAVQDFAWYFADSPDGMEVEEGEAHLLDDGPAQSDLHATWVAWGILILMVLTVVGTLGLAFHEIATYLP